MALLSLRRALPLALLAAAAVAGCFSPRQPACAFSCAAPPHACPANYTCGDDGFCHRNDGAGVCLLTPMDAAADAEVGADGE